MRLAADESARLVTLIGKISEGVHPALGDLYDRTAPILYGQLLGMLKRPEWAQEALQDCYIRVWQRSETYTAEKGEPLGWLIGIARYRALDLLAAKRGGAEMSDGDDALSDELPDQAQSPEDGAIESEGMQRLEHCLKGLSPEQRQSVLLAYYHGYSHRELSQALKAPLGTVKAWVRRGLVLLRACLQR